MGSSLVPITLAEAREFVRAHHRHNRAPVGWKFGVGLNLDGDLCGVAVASRPISRMLAAAEPMTIEIVRVCTLGDKNANSRLYGAICRAAAALGYRSAITYTRPGESGASLRASGFEVDGETKGESWDRPGRPRRQEPTVKKTRWRRKLA